jgi:hypothetical protein
MSVEERLKFLFGGVAIAFIGIAVTMAASWLWPTNYFDAVAGQPKIGYLLSFALSIALWVIGPVIVFFGLGRIVGACGSQIGTPEEKSRKAARSYRARLALPISLFIGFPVVYRWSSIVTSDDDVRRWVTFGVIAIFCIAWVAWVYVRPHPDLGKVTNSSHPHQSIPLSQKAYALEEQSRLTQRKRIAPVILASALAAALGWLVFDAYVSH